MIAMIRSSRVFDRFEYFLLYRFIGFYSGSIDQEYDKTYEYWYEKSEKGFQRSNRSYSLVFLCVFRLHCCDIFEI
jgi:hypothetical protein